MNILKYRFIAYIFSLLVIFTGIYFLLTQQLNFSTEFTGGTKLIFNTKDAFEDIKSKLNSKLTTDFNLSTVQQGYALDINKSFNVNETAQLKVDVSTTLSDFQLISLEVVEPNVGRELIVKTFYAIGFSILVIFIYVWYAFKNILSSVSALIAMLHDTLIIIGFFAVFSHFFNAEVDLLFVTAVLTILSFSLYDTIVIFDRIREIYITENSTNYFNIINKAISQTMVRSVNNSLTSLLVLFSLALFVNGSLFWFVITLLIGVIFGTYSSPFIAAPVFYDIKHYLIPWLKQLKMRRK